MAAGLAAVATANAWLNVFRGTTFTGVANVYVQLHTADPGAAGTTGVSVGSTTRVVITWSAASGGVMTITGTAPQWTNGGTSETITHVSFWSATTAGTFYASSQLTASQAWASANTFTLTTQTWALSPIAA
jgi:hypothetical protein